MNAKKISDDDGVKLVRTARKAITEFLKNNSTTDDSEFNSRFDFDSGVFVTLNKKNSLRGCIGYPLSSQKLSKGLVNAAISAATQDPRFPPVNADELEDIVVEVTVLSPPEEIKVQDPTEYLDMIKVGRDGLIVENQYASGLLLPQVPTEYGWNEEEFLGHTCEKAGLENNAWKEPSTKISRFEGVIFKEISPNGSVVRESSDDFL